MRGLPERRRAGGCGASWSGQGIVEYGLILALTMVFTTLILGVFGGPLADVLTAIGAAIDAATGGT
jgi:Flp pilus assembly pilin Flp